VSRLNASPGFAMPNRGFAAKRRA